MESAVIEQSFAPLLERDWPRGWRAHWIGTDTPAVDRDHRSIFHVTWVGDGIGKRVETFQIHCYRASRSPRPPT